MNSPEAIRSGKYAKYLNRFGLNVFVLTSERRKAGLFLRALAHYDIIPDSCGKWIKPAFEEACEIIDREKIDIIVSRSMPIVSHRVALLVKEEYPNIPWIAEFSDPWTQSTYKKYKLGIGKGRDEKFEKLIFQKADKIIATSYRTADLFLKKYPGTDVEPIPNFYDEEEFRNIDSLIRIPNKFVIMYTGNFYGIRTPEYLLKALKKLEKDGIKNIIIILIGNMGKYQKLINKYKVSKELLQIRTPVEREEAIELLKYADGYLLIDAPSKEPSVFLPSKLPEYLYMRKPILALTPEGTVNDIIRETKTGVCIQPDNVEEIKLALKYMPSLIINAEANIEKYGAMECVWDLALIIKEMIQKGGDVKDNQRLRGEAKFSEDSSIDEGL
jgi:glycosyltransferase involved in cell wall biosynthesis